MSVKVSNEKCVGCGQCSVFCPEEALRAWGWLKVDETRCTDCGICVEYCPVDALEVA